MREEILQKFSDQSEVNQITEISQQAYDIIDIFDENLDGVIHSYSSFDVIYYFN